MVKNPLGDAGNIMRCGSWENALDEGMAAHSSILAWRTPMVRGAWRATVHRVAQSQTPLKQLSMHAYIYPFFFMFFSIMDYPRILTIVPCATQYDLVVCYREEINTKL